MRCRFGTSIIFPDPLQIPDPVDFTGGTIQCTSPATIESAATKEVVFGICLIGADCEYTGKEKQAASTNSYMPSLNHFTRSSPYLYYTAPQLSTLTPSLGPREGSTYVTIRGVGFFASPFLSCRFDLGHHSTASSFIDSSTVVCKTPAITAAQYSVEITQNGQQYSGGCSGVDDSTGKTGVCWYYFYIEPIITSVAPQAGINTGLSRVLITLTNPVLNYHELHCRFQTAFAPDQKRLSIEGSTMITKASASGSTASCFSPTSVSAKGQPMLHTPTSKMPLRGLTYVSLTWNGQQYGPHDTSANTQKFWFHGQVEAVALVPSGGQIDNPQLVTLYGENFVNVPSLVVQFGGNIFLCSPGADVSECPNDDTHVQDAITFVSSHEIHFNVPTNEVPALKTIKVSNNGLPQEFSSITTQYEYYSILNDCPNNCEGSATDNADGHGTCVAKSGGLGCNCNLGYSGLDCSVGPMVLALEPSAGLATGGWHVTVIGRNIWNYGVATTGYSFKVRLDSRREVSATKASGCEPTAGGGGGDDCENKLVFVVPTTEMRVAVDGITIEITINGKDYTANKR